MTMINRVAPDASPQLALTTGEVGLLDRLAARRLGQAPPQRTLSAYLRQIAQLGGYLARAHDRPPGNTIMWRGWSPLMDIQLGAAIAKPTYG